MAAGLASAGVDVLLLGVIPTPAVAFLTGHLSADMGVVISASHNAMPDNGIKIFAAGGLKLEDSVEDAIESGMDLPWALPTGAGVGRIRSAASSIDAYLDHLQRLHPAPAGRAADRRRLRQWRRLPSGAAGLSPSRRRSDRHRGRAGRPEHQ